MRCDDLLSLISSRFFFFFFWKRNLHFFEWKRAKRLVSRFSRAKRQEKEKKKERGGTKEEKRKKQWLHSYFFYNAYFSRKKTEEAYLAVTFSKIRLDIKIYPRPKARLPWRLFVCSFFYHVFWSNGNFLINREETEFQVKNGPESSIN